MQAKIRAADSHEIRPLTGVRGFAAMLVLIYHFQGAILAMIPALALFHALIERCYLGVDLFFILSGFILNYVYQEGALGFRGYLRFLWFRLARIYPTHVATIGILAVLLLASHHWGFQLGGDYPLSALPYQLTLTQAWLMMHSTHWNFPSWSISAEWFAYLFVFPLGRWLIPRFRRGGTAFAAALTVLLLYFLICGREDVTFHFYAVVRVTCEFLCGSLLFAAYSQGAAVVRLCQRYSTAIMLLLLGLMEILPNGRTMDPIFPLVLFPLLLLALTSEESFLGGFFSSHIALFLGRISFAIYMTHNIVQRLLNAFFPYAAYAHIPFSGRVLYLAGNLAAILILAIAVYYLVEIPARNCMRTAANRWFHQNKRDVTKAVQDAAQGPAHP